MLQDQAYYVSLDGGLDNVEETSRELLVNCCGLCVLSQSFLSHQRKGRSDYYLQYMVRGELDVWIDGSPAVMSSGQAILHYPNTPYRYAMRGEKTVAYYWIHFTGSQAKELVNSCQIPNQALLAVGKNEILQRQFETIFHEFVTRDDCFHFLTAATLSTILVEIGRKIPSLTKATGTNRQIQDTLAYIHTNYSQPLSVEHLSELAHLSVSRFRTIFKASTGVSPLSYITTLRINQALQLMTQTSLAIGEIATAVGYPDPLYFSRIFKQRTGTSPTEFRSSFRL